MQLWFAFTGVCQLIGAATLDDYGMGVLLHLWMIAYHNLTCYTINSAGTERCHVCSIVWEYITGLNGHRSDGIINCNESFELYHLFCIVQTDHLTRGHWPSLFPSWSRWSRCKQCQSWSTPGDKKLHSKKVHQQLGCTLISPWPRRTSAMTVQVLGVVLKQKPQQK